MSANFGRFLRDIISSRSTIVLYLLFLLLQDVKLDSLNPHYKTIKKKKKTTIHIQNKINRNYYC